MAFSIQNDQDEGGTHTLSEINVTPFVDVMLVLLIVFMVAAPMLVVGVPVDLPKTAAPRAAAQRPPMVVSINREGRVFLRQEELPEGEVVTRLREALEAAPDAPVYVRGDREAAYGQVLRLMGRLTQAGITRVSLIAEAEPGAPAMQAR